MAIDAKPETPEWWLARLQKQLKADLEGKEWANTRRSAKPKGRPGLNLLTDYIEGRPPLARVSDGWRDGLRDVVRIARLNAAELVVGGAGDRCVPIGWTTSQENDLDGDTEAGRIAAANHLDIVGADMVRHMLSFRRGHLMLSAPRPGTEIPTITAEDPRQLIVARDPHNGIPRAALKTGRDDWTGQDLAWLTLPGYVFRARKEKRGWELGDAEALPKPFADAIPIFTAENFDGVSEFERHLDHLDRINDGIFERIVIAKYQAFRQRGIKGLPESDPVTGDPIDYSEIFSADPGALWQLPENAEMWESGIVDLSPIRMSIQDDLEHLAAVTRTPLHMVTPDAASGSAAGAETMREANTFRVRDRRRRANVAFVDCIAAALRATGHADRADVYGIRTLWDSMEVTSTASRAAAMRDAALGNVPLEVAAIDFGGFAPEDIPRIRDSRAADLIFSSQAAANAAPSPS